MMSRAERTEQILARILPSIAVHQELVEQEGGHRPFILGLTGLQGCGKSTLATDIVNALNETYNYRSIEVSLDDFYLTHAGRQNLRRRGSEPSNALLKVRGQPGTHDVALAEMILGQFSGDEERRSAADMALGCTDITLPVFDKSLFDGEGDRAPRSQWRVVNAHPPIQVVVFEGWCIGFRPLQEEEVEARWMEAKDRRVEVGENNSCCNVGGIERRFSTSTLANHSLEDLLFVNSRLNDYCESFMGPQHFDFLVHLDTMDLVNVYRWRMEQEHVLRKLKGEGMTDNQVVDFVQGYMPAYEMYLAGLREGFFTSSLNPGLLKRQLHVVLDKYRQLIKIENV